MATSLKNLSDYNPDDIPSGEGLRIGIVLSEWNHEITNALLEGAVSTLLRHGVKEEHINIEYVPGSFELPLGAQLITESRNPDAVICLGCVIQGETRHFDFICQGVTQGITDLNLRYSRPFVFGLLTTDTLQQAKDRSGGKHGNKGDEAAITALKMVQLKKNLQ
ncbi:MAG TPA: 6,7-dimethyl-8-ribityllumazine synthase [Bacteroides sp.]|nr:6,7-dimethyl-8-ribityllumazine synthase [Bacteroides sp.]